MLAILDFYYSNNQELADADDGSDGDDDDEDNDDS